jgi:hypothetical protein
MGHEMGKRVKDYGRQEAAARKGIFADSGQGALAAKGPLKLDAEILKPLDISLLELDLAKKNL